MWKSTSASGALSHFSAMADLVRSTAPCIEQARRWRVDAAIQDERAVNLISARAGPISWLIGTTACQVRARHAGLKAVLER